MVLLECDMHKRGDGAQNLRARWPDVGITGRELLELYETEGPFFSEAMLDHVEEAKSSDTPPPDKWIEG